MKSKRTGTGYSDQEKALVNYLKEKLVSRGITKFPRDWHLKQLSTARAMLAGDSAPSLQDWKTCIDWTFQNEYWQDKADHLAVVERLWPKYKLATGGDQNGKVNQRPGVQRGSYKNGKYSDRYFTGEKDMPF
jgi:hypothetical protein